MNTSMRRVFGTLFGLAFVAMSATVASVAGALPPGTPPTGSLALTPPTGNSDTAFRLSFTGDDQFCAGDGPAGYLWSSFITPIANDPATVSFGGSGTAVGPAFTSSLRGTDGEVIRNRPPGAGDGFVNLSEDINFTATLFGNMPAGDYWIGVACRFDTAESIEFWSTSITKTAVDGAGPNNFTYGPTAAVPTTTTTSTTTTTVAATSTTVTGASTSTTAVGGSTSTSLAGGSTTSSVAGGATTTTLFGSGGASSFTTIPSRTIANAGSNTGSMLLVAVLLLIGGRMVILAARRTKVVPHGDR